MLRFVGWAPAASVAAAFGVPWVTSVVLGALMLIGAAAGEWQRRRTLLAVLQQAPKGSVVEQDSGIGGPRMRIQVGGSNSTHQRRDR